jgi:hypothetical protein
MERGLKELLRDLRMNLMSDTDSRDAQWKTLQEEKVEILVALLEFQERAAAAGQVGLRDVVETRLKLIDAKQELIFY